MRDARSQKYLRASFEFWAHRGFVQRTIAQFPWRGNIGLFAVRAGAMGVDGRAMRVVQPARGALGGVGV